MEISGEVIVEVVFSGFISPFLVEDISNFVGYKEYKCCQCQ